MHDWADHDPARWPFHRDDTALLAADVVLALGALDAATPDADDHSVPLLARAARAYLDVCFFHPFVDGNARAARLIFDGVLAREGVILADVRPLFSSPIPAGDAAAYEAFLVTLVRLASAS
jgi:hypothetical protein